MGTGDRIEAEVLQCSFFCLAETENETILLMPCFYIPSMKTF